MMLPECVIQDVESKIQELSVDTKKQMAGIRKHRMLYYDLLKNVANRMMLERNKRKRLKFYMPTEFSFCPMYAQCFNESLEAANLTRDDFFSMVHHVGEEVAAVM